MRPPVLGRRRPRSPLRSPRAAMTNSTVTIPRTLRPFRYARDGVACFVLAVVANVCASITWEHYYGDSSDARFPSEQRVAARASTPNGTKVSTARFPRGLRVESYAATPVVDGRNAVDVAIPAAVLRVDAMPAATLHVDERSAGPCRPGMQLVDGLHCPRLGHVCLEFLSVARDRCKLYSREAHCLGTPTNERFCIDRFEYPNQPGIKPRVAVSFREAAEACEAEGKRLCSAKEWELACEGPNWYPYPNGHVRDAERCNIDRPDIAANNDAYSRMETRDAEVARVDQREPSGSRPGCVSGYGVEDMIGNVDEWVVNSDGNYGKPPYRSALKGGYWGRVRNRCRPTTTDHNEWHSGYQVGFRCCAAPDRELQQRM